MFERVNMGLDVVLKILSISFTGCMFLGVAVIWVYLNGLGLNKEISSTVSSPQILLTIAIYSIAVSFCIVTTLVLIPSLIKMAENGSGLIWREHFPENKGLLYFFFVFLPFPIYVCMALLGAKFEYFFMLFMLLCLSFSLRFYHFHGGPAISGRGSEVEHFLTALVSFLAVLALLIFPVIFFIKVAEFITDGEVFQWLILILMVLLYSLMVSFAAVKQGRTAYFPVVAFSIFLLVFLFLGPVSKNIIIRSGLGGYQETYLIEAKNMTLIRDSGLYVVDGNGDGAAILRNVWVVVSLPDKLIISPSKESLVIHTLPSDAILAKAGEINKGQSVTDKK